MVYSAVSLHDKVVFFLLRACKFRALLPFDDRGKLLSWQFFTIYFASWCKCLALQEGLVPMQSSTTFSHVGCRSTNSPQPQAWAF
jgi:hypothetical protein